METVHRTTSKSSKRPDGTIEIDRNLFNFIERPVQFEKQIMGKPARKRQKMQIRTVAREILGENGQMV